MYIKVFLKMFIILIVTALFIVNTNFGSRTSTAEPVDPPWQMFRHDFRHTGLSPYKGAETNNVKWSFRVEERITSSPAIGLNGTIYFGSVDGKLYAVNSEGKLAWAFQTGGEVTSSPAIGYDGTVYVGSENGIAYAIKPNGKIKWRVNTGKTIQCSPAIGGDGTIYFGSNDNHLYAIGNVSKTP